MTVQPRLWLPLQPRGRLGAIAGNLRWLLASNGLMALLSLIYLGIVTRALGVADFGRFALITGTAQMLATLLSFETWKIVVQYGIRASRDREMVWQIEKTGVLLEGISMGAGFFVVVGYFALWSDPFSLGPALEPYAIGYILIQFATLRSTPIGILRMRDDFALAAAADSVQPVVRLVGAVAAWWFAPTVQGFLIAWASAEILTLVVYWLLVARSENIGAMLLVRWNWSEVRSRNTGLGSFVLSTNVQSTLGAASRQIPLLLVGGFAGSAAAGAFRLATQLAAALSKISILVTRAAFPEIVRSVHMMTGRQIWRLIGRLGVAGAFAAITVMLVVVLFGRTILTLVGGHAFAGGEPILFWLAAAGCAEMAATSVEPLLLARHGAGKAMLARALAVGVQLGATIWILPFEGATGAAVCACLGSAIALALLVMGLASSAATHLQRENTK